jgi:hypothetical protein
MEKSIVQVLSNLIELLERIDNRLKRLEDLEGSLHVDKDVKNRLIPLSKWNVYHDWPTISSLRWLRFMGHENGFNAVCKNVGRRLVIDEQAFFEWVKENNTH